MSEPPQYWAFISYSHHDRGWARWLHRALESYRVPGKLVGTETDRGVVPRRLVPVFRDRDELASSADLGDAIRSALRDSRHLIVVCSPRAAASRWVDEEIRAFQSLGRGDRILCLIVEGEPGVCDGPDPAERECFPPALRWREVTDGTGEPAPEPLAADVRGGRRARRDARLKLVAGLLGVRFDLLRQRESARRQRRLLAITALALLLALLMGWLAVTAVLAGREARRQEQAGFRRTVGAYVSNGWRQVELEDESGALLWFAETLRLVEAAEARGVADPGAAAVHRLRIASLLPRFPTLRAVAFHAAPVEHLELSADDGHFLTVTAGCAGGEDRAAVAGRGGTIGCGVAAVHDLAQRAPPWIVLERPGEDDVVLATFRPDGSSVAAVDAAAAVRIYDSRSGEPLTPVFRHPGTVLDMAFAPSAALLATAGADGEVRLWSAETGEAAGKALAPGCPVLEIEFDAAGRRLLTRCERSLQLWDLGTGQAWLTHVPESGGLVHAAALGPRGRRLAIGLFEVGARARVRLIDLEDPRRSGPPIETAHPVSPSDLEFSPDGRYLLLVSGETAQVWDLVDDRALSPISLPTSASATAAVRDQDTVTAARFGRDAATLVLGTETGVVWSRWVDLGITVHAPLRHMARMTGVEMSADATTLLTAGLDRTARVWEVEPEPITLRYLYTPSSEITHHPGPIHVTFSDDGRALAAADSFGRVTVWGADRGRQLAAIERQGTPPGAIGFGGRGGEILWSDGEANSLRQLRGPSGGGSAVATESAYGLSVATRTELLGSTLLVDGRRHAVGSSPDGRWEVAIDQNGIALRATGGEGSWRSLGASSAPTLARFSPDSRSVLSIHDDSTVRLWNVSSGEELVPPMPHLDRVTSASFSAGGSRILTSSLDGSARLWDAGTGRLAAPLMRHRGPVAFATFDKATDLVATASRDFTIRLWDARTGLAASSPVSGGRPMAAVLFSPRGDRLVAVGADSSLWLWSLDSTRTPADDLVTRARLLSARRLDEDGNMIDLQPDEWRELWERQRPVGPAR